MPCTRRYIPGLGAFQRKKKQSLCFPLIAVTTSIQHLQARICTAQAFFFVLLFLFLGRAAYECGTVIIVCVWPQKAPEKTARGVWFTRSNRKKKTFHFMAHACIPFLIFEKGWPLFSTYTDTYSLARRSCGSGRNAMIVPSLSFLAAASVEAIDPHSHAAALTTLPDITPTSPFFTSLSLSDVFNRLRSFLFTPHGLSRLLKRPT